MNHWSVLRLVRMRPGPKPHNPYFDAASPITPRSASATIIPVSPPTQEELARLQRDLRAKAPAAAPRSTSRRWRRSALLQATPTRHTVTWIGHSTVLVQTAGRDSITDPMFSRRASPLPFTGPGATAARHRAARYSTHHLVLISTTTTITWTCPACGRSRASARIAELAVWLGLEGWFRRRLPHANVVALDWWESRVVAGVTVTLCPRTPGARAPSDGDPNLWERSGGGARRPSFLFFSGDPAYSSHPPRSGAGSGRSTSPPSPSATTNSVVHAQQPHQSGGGGEHARRNRRATRSASIGDLLRAPTPKPLDQPLRDLPRPGWPERGGGGAVFSSCGTGRRVSSNDCRPSGC